MENKSMVYFSDCRARGKDEALYRKIGRLFDAAQFSGKIDKGDLVALKTHWGLPGNQRHVRPEHVRAIVEKVKEAGGHPYVLETTGVGLSGLRGNGARYLEAAYGNGFTHDVLRAPVVLGDGVKGLWGVRVNFKGLRLKEVEIAQGLAEADAVFVLSHFKAHPQTCLAGALKQIGIGGVTKIGKAKIHLDRKPAINPEKCDNCGVCVKFCPFSAIEESEGKPKIQPNLCQLGCACWEVCPKDAITSWKELSANNEEFSLRMVDAAAAIIEHVGREKIGYVNFAYDITPHCDCFSYGDVPIVPDIGVLASDDPVAIDQASVDLVIKSPGIPRSVLEEKKCLEPGCDKFKAIFPDTDWGWQLEAAENLGLGRRNYELIKI